MSRTNPPQVAFSSGEIDPLLHRRFDYQRFQTGLATCKGFLPLAQGGFTRAPGTYYKGRTRIDDPCVLLPFVFAANDAVILEFTPFKMRVRRYGDLVLVAGVPYELSTPFDSTSLSNLRWVQSADVIYLVDGTLPIQRLARYALDNWTIGAQELKTGPFRVQNLDAAKTITPSAATGTITLTASAALFTAAHVGSLVEIQPTGDNTIPMWEPGKTIAVGDKRRYGVNYYELTLGTNTDASPPIHTEGEAVTSTGVKWKWLSDGTGIARITARASSTSATATVLRPLSPALAGVATYRWSEGAWSDVYGYPSSLEIYDQRLVGAATPSEPRTVWFSTVGDFADFTPSTEADGAFAYTIAGNGSINRVINLQRGAASLHIFALAEEISSRSESRVQTIGPTTAVFGLDGTMGTSPARPIAPDGNPILISRDKAKVLLVAYDLQQDKNRVQILSSPARHLGNETFEQIIWQAAPEPMAWLRRGNGELACMIYNQPEEVLGWATVPVAGGFVESMAVSPADDGTRDVVTLVVRRDINGATVRCIEEQAALWILQDETHAPWLANHLFCSIPMTVTTAQASFDVAHLVGQTVHVWTEQGSFGPLTVSGAGTVTLDTPVNHVRIGLFDATHRAQTLDIQAAAPDGNSTGRRKRLSRATIGLHRTYAGFAQVIENTLSGGNRTSGLPKDLIRHDGLIPDGVVHTGLARLNIPSGMTELLSIALTPDGGAPLTITAIIPEVEEGGA